MYAPALSPVSIIAVYIALSDCQVRSLMFVVDLDRPSTLNLPVFLLIRELSTILYPSINMFPQGNTLEQSLPLPRRVGNEGMEGRSSEHLC